MSNINYTPIDDLISQHIHPKQPQYTPVARPTESEPMSAKSSEPLVIQEVVEHEPDEEVKEHIEVKPDIVKIPEEVKQAGVTATEKTDFPAYNNITLPISDDKIMQGLNEPISSSLRWFATFALMLLKQSHLKLKKIHGKVVRVIVR